MAPNSIGAVDAATDELVGGYPDDGHAPSAVVWATGPSGSRTPSRDRGRIDPETNSVVRTVPASEPPPISRRAREVWVLNGLDGSVLAIDPEDERGDRHDRRSGRIRRDRRRRRGSVGDDRLDATVTRIDPETREVVATFPVGEPGTVSPEAIAVDDDAFWVADGLNPVLLEVDVATEEVVATPGLRAVATELAVGGDGTVWVTSYDADLVSVLDPSTLQATTVTVGRGPTGVAAGERWSGWPRAWMGRLGSMPSPSG